MVPITIVADGREPCHRLTTATMGLGTSQTTQWVVTEQAGVTKLLAVETL